MNWLTLTYEQQIYSLTDNEVGGQGPAAHQAFIETLFNRAQARGQSLYQTATDRKYYPGVSFRPRPGANYQDNLLAALQGSDVSGRATGNASGTVGFAGGPQTFSAGGERFGIEGPDLRGRSGFKPPPPIPDSRQETGGGPLTGDAKLAAERNAAFAAGTPDPLIAAVNQPAGQAATPTAAEAAPESEGLLARINRLAQTPTPETFMGIPLGKFERALTEHLTPDELRTQLGRLYPPAAEALQPHPGGPSEAPVLEGATQGLIEAGAPMTSPAGIALLGAIPHGVIGKTIAGGFTLQGLSQYPELYRQFMATDDPTEKAKLVAMAAVATSPALGLADLPFRALRRLRAGKAEVKAGEPTPTEPTPTEGEVAPTPEAPLEPPPVEGYARVAPPEAAPPAAAEAPPRVAEPPQGGAKGTKPLPPPGTEIGEAFFQHPSVRNSEVLPDGSVAIAKFSENHGELIDRLEESGKITEEQARQMENDPSSRGWVWDKDPRTNVTAPELQSTQGDLYKAFQKKEVIPSAIEEGQQQVSNQPEYQGNGPVRPPAETSGGGGVEQRPPVQAQEAVRPTAAAPPAEPLGEHGVATRYRPESVPGEGTTAGDMRAMGHELIAGGRNPELLRNRRAFNTADAAVAVAHDEALTRTARQARQQADADPSNLGKQRFAKAAEKAAQDWYKEIIPRVKEVFHKFGESLQGLFDLGSGNLIDYQKAFDASTRRPRTAADDVTLKKAATRVRKANGEYQKAVSDRYNDLVKQGKAKRTLSREELAESLAKKVSKLLEDCKL